MKKKYPDFQSQLRKSQLYEYSKEQTEESQKIISHHDATACLKERKACLIIYGKAKAVDKEIRLDMDAVLIHRTGEQFRPRLRKELRFFLPQFKYNDKSKLDGFQLTSNYLTYYSTYFVGIAVWSNNDIPKATEIFQNLYSQLNVSYNIPQLVKLKGNTRKFLAEIYLVNATSCYAKYQTTKIKDNLEQCHNYLNDFKDVAPIDDQYLSLESIYQFLTNRDTGKARALISKASSDQSNLLSLAFLLMYDGSLTKAIQTYKKAFRLRPSNDAVESIITFINNIIVEEPEIYQLHLCLSMIYLHKKSCEQALEEYNKFIELGGNDKLREIALFYKRLNNSCQFNIEAS